MSILQIRQQGDPVLRQIAKPCAPASPEIRQLAKDMLETLHKAGGAGLAAPQVGQSVRLIVISFGKGGPHVALANPTIVRRRGEFTSYEGCLSVSEGRRTCKVTRAAKVWVEFDDFGTDSRGSLKLKGLMAACVQHEIDHLDGKLILDYV
jgi:peptide deformylase